MNATGLGDTELRDLTFWHAARNYGLSELLIRSETLIAGLATGVVVILAAEDTLSPDRLTTIATGYLAIGGALFGIVIAGLAIFASFLGVDYVKMVGRAGVLGMIFFEFVWVAALTVFAIGLAVVVLVQTGATTEDGANSSTIGLATIFFFAALGSALRLVNRLMTQGLLRATYEERSAAIASRGTDTPPEAADSTPV